MFAREEESRNFLPIGSTTGSPPRRLWAVPYWTQIMYGVLGLVVGSIIGYIAYYYESSSVDAGSTEERLLPPSIVHDSNPTASGPRIAWLMSFPNSGTSYTLNLVRSASLHYTASNYGEHHIDSELGVSIPVFDDSPNGPFWSDPGQPADPANTTLRYPDHGYVITKTHCGTRCMGCRPSSYMETQHQFLVDCLSGRYIAENVDGETISVKEPYNASLVHRAIHLIRNPFNNIVARFHLELHHRPDTYKNDKDGYRHFCLDLSAKWKHEEEKSTLLENATLNALADVPCYADFIRYVRWHNLAFTATENLQVPTMTLHYESYETHFDHALVDLLAFLQLDLIGPPHEFITGKDYMDYYTDKEIRDVRDTFKELAYLETWQNIKHYFEDRQ